MSSSSIDLGRRGEALACDQLAAAGFRVLARNWCWHAGGRSGEIDVIAARPGLLVFCEVKTRRGHAYGSPAAAVTSAKQAQLRRLATAYLAATLYPPGRIRFDVPTITWARGRDPVVHHLEG